MKIGIISEFKIDTVNYGNNLQAYALNRYLRNTFPDLTVETIYFDNDAGRKNKVTSYLSLLRIKLGRVWWKIKGKRSRAASMNSEICQKRLEGFHRFQRDNIALSPAAYTWEKLLSSDYDIFIVGSDVVWNQSKAFINRIKFLDFKNTKNAAKVAYAASFGQNVIPGENRRAIRKALRDFKAISVREGSAVELLRSIGVKGAVQTVDPTLLLSQQEWAALERRPGEISRSERFVFAYLLGANKEQKSAIEQICKNRGLPVVYIPCASGAAGEDADEFGDISVRDCSPEEWVWLIHHAQYVITDSFHGIVFSTVFEKRFLALKRNYIRDINVRLTDYLSLIRQEDKAVDRVVDLDTMRWDYADIQARLERLRASSRSFLNDACGK